VAAALQHEAKHATYVGIVVDNEYSRHVSPRRSPIVHNLVDS
jgi:hypothetical protein